MSDIFYNFKWFVFKLFFYYFIFLSFKKKNVILGYSTGIFFRGHIHFIILWSIYSFIRKRYRFVCKFNSVNLFLTSLPPLINLDDFSLCILEANWSDATEIKKMLSSTQASCSDDASVMTTLITKFRQNKIENTCQSFYVVQHAICVKITKLSFKLYIWPNQVVLHFCSPQI